MAKRRYLLLREIGRGAMGEVYLAEDTKLDRKVALKFLSDALKSDKEYIDRMIREAKIIAALEHPGIVHIYDFDYYQYSPYKDRFYISMEYVEGKPLKAFLRESPGPTLIQKLDIAQKICEALVAAHSKGIVHRDIKPDNIYITQNRMVKLLDFGLAKSAGITHTISKGKILGTPHYMSPEQTEGAELDFRSDIFSFGTVFYELLTGERPFKGDNFDVVKYNIQNKIPDPVSHYEEDATPGVQKIIDHCLAKRHVDRYQSAKEIVTDLKLEIEWYEAKTKVEPKPKPTPKPKPLPQFILGWVQSTWKTALVPSWIRFRDKLLVLKKAIQTRAQKIGVSSRWKSTLYHSWIRLRDNIHSKMPAIKETITSAAQKIRCRISIIIRKKSVIWAAATTGAILLFLGILWIITSPPPPTPPTAYAQLYIESDPLGAAVFMDGDSIGITPIQNYLLKADSDAHGFNFQLKGYGTVDTSMVFMAADSVPLFIQLTRSPTVSLARETPSPRPAPTQVSRQTPNLPESVPEISSEIHPEKPTDTIPKQPPVKIKPPAKGVLLLQIRPCDEKLKVEIDEEQIRLQAKGIEGLCVYSGNLSAGVHSLLISYKDQKLPKKITMVPGDTLKLPLIDFKRKFNVRIVVLDEQKNPLKGCSIYIDYKHVGYTNVLFSPKYFEIPTGQHTFSVLLNGYSPLREEDWKKVINLEDHLDEPLIFYLKKNP